MGLNIDKTSEVFVLIFAKIRAAGASGESGEI